MEQLKDDLREIKADIKDLIKQGAIHNVLLQQHEARSLALQKSQEHLDVRISPIEDHVKFLNKSGKVIMTLLIGAAVGAATKLIAGLF